MRVQNKNEELSESVEWFLDYLRIHKASSINTVQAYRHDLEQAMNSFTKHGGKSWKNYDEHASTLFQNELKKSNLSQRTIARKLSALRTFLKFLSQRNQGPKGELINPFSMKKQRTLPKSLDLEQMITLLETCETNTAKGLRDRAMLELLYGTGMRVSELITLQIEDYNASESVIRVTGKRNKTRMVPIPVTTHEWLRRYLGQARPVLLKNKKASALIVNSKGNALSRSGVFRIIQELAVKAGIDKVISPHTLRHTFASHLVKAGADLRSVQELLGHEYVATTEVYTHLDLETVKTKYATAHPRSRIRKP